MAARTLRLATILPMCCLCFIISACSLDASVFDGRSPLGSLESQKSREYDFVYGEVVTTHGGTPGYVVKAFMGEIPQKSESLNGNQWRIEGVFVE